MHTALSNWPVRGGAPARWRRPDRAGLGSSARCRGRPRGGWRLGEADAAGADGVLGRAGAVTVPVLLAAAQVRALPGPP
jgi:hypothetical protein